MAQRLRGLDGLRGIAVAAVVLYHFDVPWIPGGFLGVDIFFVISGFIITTLLLEEVEREQQIRLRAFYARRARRLLPTLLAMMSVAVIACGLWATDASASLRSDIPWALAFGVNWSAIAMQRSYFVAMSRPPVLEHLWSLAIEEQFYIVWPGALLVMLRLRNTLAQSWVTVRGLVFLVSAFGAAASTWRMHSVALAAGMPVPTDPTRAYFGTDTHSMSLLVGCAVAALWHREQFAQWLAPRTVRAWDALGVAALAAVVITMVTVTELLASNYLIVNSFESS